MLKKDNLRFGLFIGFIVPIIGCVVYYFIQFSNKASFKVFLELVLQEKQLMTAMLSILIVANIAIFTYYINIRKDRTAKGLFIATLIYGLLSVFWKFFF